MIKKYKILGQYIKDLSSETPNVESFLYTKDNISKYELDIDINSKPLKNKLIEVNTTLKFQDKKQVEKKSYFEVVYSSIVKIGDEIKEKKDLQKIKAAQKNALLKCFKKNRIPFKYFTIKEINEETQKLNIEEVASQILKAKSN